VDGEAKTKLKQDIDVLLVGLCDGTDWAICVVGNSAANFSLPGTTGGSGKPCSGLGEYSSVPEHPPKP
jgi:hypothetical protein